jgi:hypothetical protein
MKAVGEGLDKFRELGVDDTEFACSRAILLFKGASSGDVMSRLKDVGKVDALEDQSQLTLSRYIGVAYAGQPLRFGRLLLLLPLLKSLRPNTIHSLFFRKTVGSIPIQNIICDMIPIHSRVPQFPDSYTQLIM